MSQYVVTRIAGQPDWDAVPYLDVAHFNWEPEMDIRMKAQICYDANGLYVHLRTWEKNIRAEYDQPLSPVYEDSCMEFFFCPVDGDMRYFNFEINPNGCMYIGFGTAKPRPIRLVLQDEDVLLQKRIRRTTDGWEAFYTVPVSLIQDFYPGYQLESGKKLRANCYKCGDKTPHPHFISWNPMTSPTPCFHRPEDFGKMILE